MSRREPFRTIRPGVDEPRLGFSSMAVLLSIEVGATSFDELHHETGLPSIELAIALELLERGCYVTTVRGRYRRPRAAGLCVPTTTTTR